MTTYAGGRAGEGFPQLDLSGKLIIKVQLGDDIRLIPIHNEDITYDELVLMMQRVYRGKLTSSDEVTIKYKDEDGDLITIYDSSDLSFAIQCSKILKITLFVNGQPRPLEGDDIRHIRRELRQIRDQVNHLLDSLEPRAPVVVDHEIPNGEKAAGDSPRVAAVSPKPATNIAGSREFDPLSSQKAAEENTQTKVMSSFGISSSDGTHGQRSGTPAQRTGTPDSVSSMGSAGPQGPKQPQGSPMRQAPYPAGQQPHPGYSQQAGFQGGQNPQAPSPAGYGQQTPASAGYPPQPGQQGHPQQAGQGPQPGHPQPGHPQPGHPQPGHPQPGQPGYSGGYPGQQAGQQAGPGQPYPASASPAQSPYPQAPYAQQAGGAGYPQTSQASGQNYYNQAGGPPQAGGANPYSRGGPTYGQYPRPQGQYPQQAYQ